MANLNFNVNINGEEIAVNGKSELNGVEAIQLANGIIYDMFGDGDTPILYLDDFFIRKNIISRYTDYVLPDDINECFDIVYNTKLYDKTVEKLGFDNKQHEILMAGIKEQIKFEKTRCANKTKLDDLFDTIIDVVQKIDGKIDIAKIGGILEKLNKLEKIDEKALAEAVLSIQKKPRKKTGK